MDVLKNSIRGYEIRKEIFALFCLTVIAIVAMLKLADPENIVINIILVIASFGGGYAMGSATRRAADPSAESGNK